MALERCLIAFLKCFSQMRSLVLPSINVGPQAFPFHHPVVDAKTPEMLSYFSEVINSRGICLCLSESSKSRNLNIHKIQVFKRNYDNFCRLHVHVHL